MITADRALYVFMAIVGIASGVILIAVPASRDFVVAPYFWILIAVALFEFGTLLFWRADPMPTLTRRGRVIGFVGGLVLMFGISWLGGAQVKFF
jgi:hypothetical protein